MFAKIRRFQDQWNTYKARLKNESTGKYWIVETVEALSVALVFALLIRHFIIMVSVMVEVQ